MAAENITYSLLNAAFQAPYDCLKCVVPEAVIPVSWRILIILNLVFTALVYVSFVLEGVKRPSAQQVLGFLKKRETFAFMRWVVAFCCFASILVQPFSGGWAFFQMGMILVTGWLLFREGDSAFRWMREKKKEGA